jgi:hypothetical protein
VSWDRADQSLVSDHFLSFSDDIFSLTGRAGNKWTLGYSVAFYRKLLSLKYGTRVVWA